MPEHKIIPTWVRNWLRNWTKLAIEWNCGGVALWRDGVRTCAPVHLPGQAQHQDPLEPSPHGGVTEAEDRWVTMRRHNRL